MFVKIKNMKMKNLFLILLIGLTLVSCKKVEGEGGSATIKGVIYEKKINNLGNIISLYPAADQDVYIIYGNDNTFYDDNIKTSYDGTFEFPYLQKGNYTVFVYEDCEISLSCPSGKKEILVPVEITEKKQIINLDTITVLKL